MSNISKIKISGTSYNLKDENACKVVELTQAEYDDLPTTAKTSNSLFVITDATAGDLSNYYTKTETDNAITASTSTKQDTLVSGTNIKTINGETLLGEGNITIQGGGGGKAIEAGRGISITTGETADTVSFNLPISAGTGTNSIIEGSAELANGISSHAEGTKTIASSENSHPEGMNTIANNMSEHASGQYNNSVSASTTFGDSGNTLFSVGNGTADNARHNAFEIRQNGDIYCSDGTNDVKLQDTITATAANTTALGGLKLVKLTQSEYDSLTTKDNSTLYVIVN